MRKEVEQKGLLNVLRCHWCWQQICTGLVAGSQKEKESESSWASWQCSAAREDAGWEDRQISMPYAEYFLHMKTTGCDLGAESRIRLG